MQNVTSAWVLITIGLVLIAVAVLAGPAYGWITVLGLAVGALLVLAGLRKRRRLVSRPTP